MTKNWMLYYKAGVALGGIVVIELAILIVAITPLPSVNGANGCVFTDHPQLLIDAQALRESPEAEFADVRAFMLSRYDSSLQTARHAPSDFSGQAERLKRAVQTEDASRLVQLLERAEVEYEAAVKAVVAFSRSNAELESFARAFEEEWMPEGEGVAVQRRECTEHEHDVLEKDHGASNDLASSAITPEGGGDR